MEKSRKRIVKYAVGLIAAGGVAAAAIGFLAMSLGMITISARPPHMAITTFFLHYTFKKSTAREASDITAPEDLMSPERVALGIQHYNNVCSSCHGGPDLGQSPIALSMRPRPQHLPAVVDQFSDEQLYIILRNGVRFSAMPHWPADSNYSEIWSLVAFLRALPDMSADEYIAATQRPMPDGAPELPFEADQPLGDMVVGTLAEPLEEYYYARPGTGWHEYANNGEIIATCAACHGEDGSGSPTGGLAPNLTVQSADYIEKALQGYASGDRPSGIMMTVAASLTDEQITGLAAYYADLPDAESPVKEALSGDPARGEMIALNGKPDAAMPACYTCHQNIEDEANMLVPAIAGQSALYLENKLDQFATRQWTGGDVWRPMGFVAHALTEQERVDLAAYFAAQPIGMDAPGTPFPQGNPADAEPIVAQVCAECHTKDGNGVESGAYPNLTIQVPTYLEQQLHAFRTQERDNETMTMVAQELTDQNMIDLALYFGGDEALPTPQPSEAFATDQDISAGQQIAENGIEDKNIPACLSCHNAETVRDLPIVARLHGQSANYIQNRLQHLGSQRSSDLYSLSPMHMIAQNMDVDERRNVAAWFAAQEPIQKR